MNKKTVIIIISIIVALAIAIGATIFLLGSKFTDAPDKDGQSNITSSDNSNAEGTDSSPSSNETDSSNPNGSSNNDLQDDSTVSVPKANKDMTTFIVGNAEAEKGGKVSVPVYVSANKGFMAVMASFKYDTAALKYTGYKKGNILSDYEFQEVNGVIKFISVERGDVTKDGVAFYLEFDVIATSPTTTPVEVTIESNGIGNKAEQYVPVDTINGNVTIK